MAMLLLGAVLAGCSTPPPPTGGPIELPDTFSASGTAPLPDKWWESFQDPVLTGLIERALGANLDLQTAWDRLAQADAAMRQAGASLWPAVDGEAGVARTIERGPVPGGTGPGRQTTYHSDFSLGLVASYEFDLWGRVRSTRDAAALNRRATREQLQAAAMTLSATVAATWYGLVEQHGQVALLQEQLRTNQQVLELVTLRFRRGQAGAVDVLQQRQLVESRRGDLAAAESRAAVLAHQLAILLGEPPRAKVAERTATLAPLPPLPETGVPAALVQRRPDLRQAYLEVLAADRRVAAAIADRFPRITLGAQAATTAANVRDLFDNWLATLAANLVAPLFDAGARGAAVERQRAVMAERFHQYGQTVLTALGEVEDALVQERQQRALIASLEKQLELSRHVIDRTRDSYTKGAVDYLRVLDALSTHQALQRTHLQAQRQLIEFRINLGRALGGGWDLTPPARAERPLPESS
ncbi:efflux transporter outer membrane subunit [bacterium]|nr:efflux transporter outer membrane subunit [bacterium]